MSAPAVNDLLPAGALRPVGAPAPAPRTGRTPPAHSPRPAGFADALERASGELTFSGHAAARLQRRGIDVGRDVMARLGEGVQRAAAKGSRDAVVLVDDTAFVVSVANRTVITAVDRDHMRDQVFTNIDSAVIA
ncbi:MAG TPA: TIGR02530 family flagellar biosynthesis protein [Solirubrobacteraceae bacterium]|nr:TIGR02530 family flagellar biosynthesis protein [Solirubrobacteraceae bacterium]